MAEQFQYQDFSNGAQIQAAKEAAAAAPKATFTEAFMPAWRTETMIDSAIKAGVGAQFVPDANYRLPKDDGWKELTKDIPVHMHGAFTPASSEAHAQTIRYNLLQELEDRKTLASAGATGVGAAVTAAIADPAQLLLSVVTGGMGTSTKVGKLSNFFRSGVAAGGSNAAIEAYLNQQQYTRDPSDILTAGLLGFAIGGPIGLLTRQEMAAVADLGNKGALSRQIDTIKQAGGDIQLTEKGKALDETLTQPVEQIKGKVMPAHVADAIFQKQLREDFRVGIKGALDEVLNEAFPLRGKPLPTRVAEELPPVATNATPEELALAGTAAKRTSVDHQAVSDYQAQVEELLNPAVVPSGPAIATPSKADMAALNAYRKVAGADKQPTAMELAFAKAQVTKAAGDMRGDIKTKLQASKEASKAEAEAAARLRETQAPKEVDPASAQRQAEHEAALAQREQQKMDELMNSESTPSHEVGFKPGDQVFWVTKKGDERSGKIKEVDHAGGTLKVIDDETGRVVKVPRENLDMPDAGDTGGFLPGSAGSAQVLPTPGKSGFTEIHIPFTNIRIPIRYDYFSIFDRSANESGRRYARDLLEDSVGEEGGGHRAITASAYAELERGTYRARFYSAARDSFDEFVRANDIPVMGRRAAENQFFADVTAIVRGDLAITTGNPHAAKVAQAVRSIHEDLLAQMKQHGVQGAEEVLPDASYMMRRFNHNKIAGLIDNFTQTGVEQLVAHAIRSARFLPIEDALRIAKSYVRTVGMLQHTPQLGHSVFTLKDHAVLRDALKAHGVDPKDIESVIEIMRGIGVDKGGDAGNVARLKKRTGMDENYRMQLRGKDGKMQDVSITDMFENDARLLMDIYTKQTTGHIGLARVGIKSRADHDARMLEMSQESFSKLQDGNETKKLIGYFDDIYNHIVGNPMAGEQFGKGQRIARFLRDINFTRMMGQAGFAQVAEIGNLIGLAGFRAATMHMPEIGNIIKLAKGGLLPDPLAKDLMKIGGFGAEVMGSHPVGRELDEVMFDRTLSRAEQLAQTAKYYTAHLSGLHAVNNSLRQVAARAFTQRFTDIALGITKRNAALDKRLATSGLDESNIDGVLEGIRRFVDVDKQADSKITGIRWEEWQKVDPQSADLFRLATWREARRAVQEHTIGETAPWMNTTIGKILTQFRTFTLVAHSKQFLHGVNHADMQTATAWSLSSLFAGLSYTAQTSLNYAHNERELQRRLTIENISKSAFQRSGFSSLIPMGIDTVANFTSGESIFAYGRTTGLGTGAITGNPTFDLVSTKGLGTMQNFTQSIFNDQHMWTKKDVKNGLGLVVPNMLLLRNFVDATASEFPEKNYLKEYKPRQ